jgi:hypothetical protein
MSTNWSSDQPKEQHLTVEVHVGSRSREYGGTRKKEEQGKAQAAVLSSHVTINAQAFSKLHTLSASLKEHPIVVVVQ